VKISVNRRDCQQTAAPKPSIWTVSSVLQEPCWQGRHSQPPGQGLIYGLVVRYEIPLKPGAREEQGDQALQVLAMEQPDPLPFWPDFEMVSPLEKQRYRTRPGQCPSGFKCGDGDGLADGSPGQGRIQKDHGDPGTKGRPSRGLDVQGVPFRIAVEVGEDVPDRGCRVLEENFRSDVSHPRCLSRGTSTASRTADATHLTKA